MESTLEDNPQNWIKRISKTILKTGLSCHSFCGSHSIVTTVYFTDVTIKR